MALAVKRAPQIFERSRLKNEYRGILDHARADGAVVIRDEGNENLYLVRGVIYGQLEAARAESQTFAQLVYAVERALSTKTRPDALSLGRLSWASDLRRESFAAFVGEYIESFFRAINDGDWAAHEQMVTAWQDTAVIERDPELMARILDRGPAGDHVELPRPDPE
jgi:hypothetical protein